MDCMKNHTRPDDLQRDYLSPVRILWQEGNIQNPEKLLRPFDGQTSMTSDALCCLNGPASLLLDFGRELNGGICFITRNLEDARPAQVRLRFGESVSEAMGEPDNDHALHDMTVSLPWLGRAEYGNTGFRFVRVDLLEGVAELREVAAVFVHSGAEWQGSFRCNDDRLNAIWNTAVWTVYLNMQDYLWDGVKRDRLVWAGDIHPESRVISAVFGAHPVLPRSLDRVRDETPLPDFMNNISSYSIWWILTHYDWFQSHGNQRYLAEQRDYLLPLLEHLAQYVDQEGKEQLPEKRFLDWPSEGNTAAIHVGLQALLSMGFARGGELCQALGEAEKARKYATLAGKMRAIRPTLGNHKQSAAFAALAGLEEPEKVNREVLAKNPLTGLPTFQGYYVLEARALAGDYAGAMETIRNYWGAMLDLGATSFWEDFDMDWVKGAERIDQMPKPDTVDIHRTYGDHCYAGLRHSLCHGWAGGPAAWLSEHVLGIKILEPGASRIMIQPQLADLDWVEGSWPTPHGLIQLRHEKQEDGTVQTDLDLPKAIEARIDTTQYHPAAL